MSVPLSTPSEKRPLQNKKCLQGSGSAHVGNHCAILCTIKNIFAKFNKYQNTKYSEMNSIKNSQMLYPPTTYVNCLYLYQK